MTVPSLVLFDVDGTLITSGGAGARSWRYAFQELHGIPADIGSHSEAGETDPVVARKTFEGAVGREPTERELAAIYALYLRRLSDEVDTSEGYRVLSGAEGRLEHLSDAGIMLGIGFAMLGRLFTFLGLLRDWPPFWSAILPTLMFLTLAIGMMWWGERR